MTRLTRFALACSAATALASSGAPVAARVADPVIDSLRASRPMTADGTLLDWEKLTPVTEGLQIAVANDDTSLYIALLATTPQMRLNLAGGVVLWFDPTGGHKETFGLQLPRPVALDPESIPGGGDGGARLTPSVSDRIDVLGPGKLARRLVMLEPSSGLGAGVGGEDGAVVFEARIPLAKSPSDAMAIGTAPGRTLSLGIASPLKRLGPREPLEPIIWPNPYSYYYSRYRMMPTAPLTNAADRPPKEMKPKTVDEWLTVRLAK